MNKKSIFKNFAIILGVIMLFSLGNVQAAEITSIFTGRALTRSSIQTVSSDQVMLSTLITLQRVESGYKYNAGQTEIWKFVDKDNQNDMYYCLNKDQGFTYSTEAEYNYATDLNITDLNKYSTNNVWNQARYNKILWILDNVYVPNESVDIYEDESCLALLEKAGIDTQRYSTTYDLIAEDIITAQRLAIWNITNGLDVTGSITGVPDQDIRDQETGDTILSRKSKIIKLYNYLVKNASETYTIGVPTLTIKGDIEISETTNSYIFGPYSFIGSNLDKIKKIEATVNHDYTLLDSQKTKVNNNDFTKVLNQEFYLQIPKSEIIQSTEVSLDIVYKYDYRTFKFMTNSSDPDNTQPVVIVKSEEREDDPSISTDIEIISVEVEKKWEDADNQDGTRPSFVNVQLYKDGEVNGSSITLNSSNNWKYTWTKLLKGPEYTIKELNTNGDKVENNEKYNDDYIASYVIEGNKTTITNTHEPEKISKTVTKIWDDNSNQDGIRPNLVKVSLFKEVKNIKQKVEEVELNSSNEWKYTWNDLDKFENGEPITYLVEETIPNGYTPSYSNDTFTINNKYTPGVISKTIVKQWDDQENVDGIRPSNVTVQLYANGKKYGEEIVLDKENGFTYTWTNLPEKESGVAVDYSVSEVKIGKEKVEDNSAAGYTVTYEIEGNIITATNRHIPEKTGKTVTKIWSDNDNKNNTRPNSIKIQLYANGEKYGNPITLTSGSDKVWQTEELTYTWSDLPLNKDGEEITYTVKELDKDANVVEDEGKFDARYITTYSEDTFTITNTYKQFDLALRKFITQINDEIYLREPVVDISTIPSAGTATYKHSKMPIAVQKGDIVTYTIRVYNEGEIDGYVDEITDYLPDNLLPIIEGIEGIDSEKYKEEIEFNTNWLWEYTGEGEVVKTKITAADKASNLPGIAEDKQEDARLLKAYAAGSEELDYVDVQIKCLVTDKVVSNEYLTNIAEITDSQDINGNKSDGNDSELDNVDYSNLSDYKNEEAIESTKDSYVEGQEDDDDFEKLVVKEFDLSLRKFITKVNETSHSREPIVDTSKLGTTVDGKTVTTAIYNHTKEPVLVETNDIVTYTIRVYNEGSLAGYVNEITDDIPEGLEFLPNSDINVSYKWKMLDAQGNETKDVSKAVIIVTDYLSDNDENNIINAVSEIDGVKTLSYKDVEVQFKVVAKAEKQKDNLIINEAQISADSDRDIDSIPNRNEKYDYTSGNNEDDIDYEPIKLKYFDLALRKFITKVNAVDYNNRYPEVKFNNDGSITYNHSKDPVLVTTNDTVVYTIRVYNEGEKSGYATEIIDNLPEGLEFILDNEINKQYSWKLIDSEGNITEELDKAEKVSTDYLKNELIEELVIENGSKKLSYKDVQIAFKVIEQNTSDRILVNIAEISKDSDEDVDSIPGNNQLTEDDIDREYLKLKYFDLALRKFITKVNSVDFNNRYPEVKFNNDGSITYNHTKDPVLVTTNDTVVYTIRVYNEGEKAGYATGIIDNLPEGLEFILDNEINKQYGWKLIDSEGNITEELDKAEKVSTDYLKNELIEELVIENGSKKLSYKDVQIAFKVVEPNTSDRILVNIAEISNDSDEDVDSIPGNNELIEDDIDREYIKVQYFDLSLKKWVTKTQVTYNGKTTTTKTGFTEASEDIAKVDLVASKMNKTTVKFTYSIKVTNEGELPGYAYEVRDYIPNGLKFVAADNKDWKESEDGTVVTDKLKDTLLNPGESATVEIVLTWKNSTTNTGLKTNYAEITEDSADDIDSVPDNYNKKEDDIDDAQVILSIKTAGPQTYIGLILVTVAILAGGIFLIKKYVIQE